MSHYPSTPASFGRKKKKSLMQFPTRRETATQLCKWPLLAGCCGGRAWDQRTDPRTGLSQIAATAEHPQGPPPQSEGKGWLPRTHWVWCLGAEKGSPIASRGLTELEMQETRPQHHSSHSWAQNTLKKCLRVAINTIPLLTIISCIGRNNF